MDAVNLVLTRTSIGVGMMRMDVPKRMARCVAGGLVETYPVSQLVDPKFGANDPPCKPRSERSPPTVAVDGGLSVRKAITYARPDERHRQ